MKDYTLTKTSLCPTTILCLAQFIGIIGSAFISGALISLSVLTIPALKAPNISTPDTATRFRALVFAVRRTVPFLAILPTASFAFLAWKAPDAKMAHSIAALCSVAFIPYTLLFMMRTNRAIFAKAEVLESKSRGPESSEAENLEVLLNHWVMMNSIRGFLPLLGALVGLSAVLL
ncbi:hypothetical protein V1508DRAFT_419898 [Lipomyces doorenjongii]|uniref:uncharacterized protein n=1 Tax=Lipomyces doorenjongii TaxID=383834 RepID=UPI0034CDBCE1